jgi:DNA-binding beta-propeller fold protein YncE
VAVDASGNVYVTEEGNDRIQKFDAAGTFLSAWGSSGSNDGEFVDPYSVAVAASGDIFVTDAGNQRVQKFTPVSPVEAATWGGRRGAPPAVTALRPPRTPPSTRQTVPGRCWRR